MEHCCEKKSMKWLESKKRKEIKNLLGKRNSSNASVISVHSDPTFSGCWRTTGKPTRRISIREWTASLHVVWDVQSYFKLKGSRKRYEIQNEFMIFQSLKKNVTTATKIKRKKKFLTRIILVRTWEWFTIGSLHVLAYKFTVMVKHFSPKGT